jgi:hypothetical protein
MALLLSGAGLTLSGGSIHRVVLHLGSNGVISDAFLYPCLPFLVVPIVPPTRLAPNHGPFLVVAFGHSHFDKPGEQLVCHLPEEPSTSVK